MRQNPSTDTSRAAMLTAEKFRTSQMNLLVKDLITCALRDEKRNMPNQADYDLFYSGLMSLQTLKNFTKGSFYLSREMAEVMLEAASYHYLAEIDVDTQRSQDLLTRVRLSGCDRGRMTRISEEWHSIYLSEGVSLRLLVDCYRRKTQNSSEF